MIMDIIYNETMLFGQVSIVAVCYIHTNVNSIITKMQAVPPAPLSIT